jgi:hypothetical protein
MMIDPRELWKKVFYVLFMGESRNVNDPAVLIQLDYDSTYPAIASEYLSPQAEQIEIGRYELIMSMC